MEAAIVMKCACDLNVTASCNRVHAEPQRANLRCLVTLPRADHNTRSSVIAKMSDQHSSVRSCKLARESDCA